MAENFYWINRNQIMKQEATIPNTVFKSTLLIPKNTLDKIDEGPDQATPIKYEDFKKFVDVHKNALFKAGETYKMVLLTEAGWRSGRPFEGNEFDFYDPELFYNDGEDDVEFVFAVQIIKM